MMLSIIPQVNYAETRSGSYCITRDTAIMFDEQSKDTAHFLQNALQSDIQFFLSFARHNKGNAIRLRIKDDKKQSHSAEAYTINIGEEYIDISSMSTAGLFYGIQSLRQMVLFTPNTADSIVLSHMRIQDQPRFRWRAFMLDESRHFKGMEQVKKLLDEMALLKMNVFHWHLTDDQGWRIEIKKYPKLTEIGSKRSKTQKAWKSQAYLNEVHEGFYTQEQIRDIVAYAQERHITVVPEIDMPGHATAAIASYPWLGTSGKHIEVETAFGVFHALYEVSSPRVYAFLQDILEEVIHLFPSEVIHIGGDEVPADEWKASPSIQAFMKAQGLPSISDLQIYFTNRMSGYLASKGKRMMGWNEILGDDIHGDRADIEIKESLSSNSIIHFWIGNIELAKRALQNGYDIVNSLCTETYLDYPYADTAHYPAAISVQRAYNFDPIPAGLDIKYHKQVLGTGAQMWSEWIPTVEQMDRQIFPRLASYAEIGWTSLERKEYEHFAEILSELKKVWDSKGIAYTD